MQAPYELRLLASYRARGQAPQLPVFVTTLGHTFVSNLRASGVFVIPTRDIDAAPGWGWEALAGLDVVLALYQPELELVRAVRSARPRRLRNIDWSAPMGERMSVMA